MALQKHNVLITGASGYLGGTLLHQLTQPTPSSNPDRDVPLPKSNLFALTRNQSQAEAVKSLYGVTPLTFDVYDAEAVRDAVLQNKITVVYFLIDPVGWGAQVNFIKALGEVKRLKLVEGVGEVHFLHAVQTNITVTEESEKQGVRTYIFTPCIVYGKGEGFGNKISIQTVDIVQAAKATGRMYKVDDGKPSWPVCHIQDNTSLYIALLRGILKGGKESPDYGRNGFYLAASGSVVWDNLYEAMAVGLAKRGVIEDSTVVRADQVALEKMGAALKGAPPEFVSVFVGGLCTFTAEHGKKLGWKAEFGPEHILEAADEEVDWILEHL